MKYSFSSRRTKHSIIENETTGILSYVSGRVNEDSIQLPKLPQAKSQLKVMKKTNNSSLPNLVKILSSGAVKLKKFTEKKYQRVINPHFLSFDESKSMILQEVNEQRDLIYKYVKIGNFDLAIEGIYFMQQVMKNTIRVFCNYSNLAVFCRAIEVLADLYFSNREFSNGTYCYNQLRQIADASEDFNLKIRSIVELADICRVSHKFKECQLFLKKALQYVWLINDPEQETMIYDKLGMVNYLMGNLQKASYYHERSMNQLIEIENSPAKKHGVETTKKHLKNIPFHTKKLSLNLLSKLGMLADYQDESKRRLSSYQNLKLSTPFDFQFQIENILSEPEFEVEISTPHNPQNLITNNGLIKDENLKRFDNEVVFLHKVMARKKFFQKADNLVNPKEKVVLDKSVLKPEINQLIKMRLKEITQKPTSVDIFVESLKKHHSYIQTDPSKLNKFLMNHLSPNRNVEGFMYHYKPVKAKVKLCFDEFVASLLASQL